MMLENSVMGTGQAPASALTSTPSAFRLPILSADNAVKWFSMMEMLLVMESLWAFVDPESLDVGIA